MSIAIAMFRTGNITEAIRILWALRDAGLEVTIESANTNTSIDPSGVYAFNSCTSSIKDVPEFSKLKRERDYPTLKQGLRDPKIRRR